MAGENILMTGKPGVGKTTIIRKTIKYLQYPSTGFYTEEIRRNNKRVGFQIISIETGKKLPLAHVDFSNTQERVGKYGVKPENLLDFIKEINQAININRPVCLVMDEIGKMEFYTPGFKETVQKALDSTLPLIGTILSKPHALCDAIKQREDVEVIEVTFENRGKLSDYLVERLKINS